MLLSVNIPCEKRFQFPWTDKHWASSFPRVTEPFKFKFKTTSFWRKILLTFQSNFGSFAFPRGLASFNFCLQANLCPAYELSLTFHFVDWKPNALVVILICSYIKKRFNICLQWSPSSAPLPPLNIEFFPRFVKL